MFLRTWSKNGRIYASVVKNVRDGKKVLQETVIYLGLIEEEQVPYLKAAYSKKKHKLVYEDGTTYQP